MGIPLHRIKDVRLLYGEEPWADEPINFKNPRHKPVPKGHVIACRVTSENPDEVDRKEFAGFSNSIVFFVIAKVFINVKMNRLEFNFI